MSAVRLDRDTPSLANGYEEASTVLAKAGRPLVNALALKDGDRVLDVGCGTGLLARYAATIVGPTGAVVGIDPLPYRIELAREQAAPNIEFRVASVMDLSGFAPDSFDGAYMNAVLHWLPEKREPLRHLWRVLSPGARLGITTAARGYENTMQSALWRVLQRPPYDAFPDAESGRPQLVSRDELAAILDDAGFSVDRLELQPSISMWTGAGAASRAIGFFETISFGNFWGHLPADLCDAARADLIAEIEAHARPHGICIEGSRLTAVAVRRA